MSILYRLQCTECLCVGPQKSTDAECMRASSVDGWVVDEDSISGDFYCPDCAYLAVNPQDIME